MAKPGFRAASPPFRALFLVPNLCLSGLFPVAENRMGWWHRRGPHLIIKPLVTPASPPLPFEERAAL